MEKNCKCGPLFWKVRLVLPSEALGALARYPDTQRKEEEETQARVFPCRERVVSDKQKSIRKLVTRSRSFSSIRHD